MNRDINPEEFDRSYMAVDLLNPDGQAGVDAALTSDYTYEEAIEIGYEYQRYMSKDWQSLESTEVRGVYKKFFRTSVDT